MSHFTVLVIGDNVERQLAPYHEFECTGTDDEFVVEVDDTAEVRSEFEDRDEAEQTFLEFAQDWTERPILKPGDERSDEHKYGFIQVSDDGEVTTIRRTNPNAEWDWWVVGGRWNGFLPTKSGERCNTTTVGDLDMSGGEAAEKAAQNFDEWMAIYEEFGKPESWVAVRKANEDSIERARLMYNRQPAIKAWKRHPRFKGWWMTNPVEEFGFDRAAYIERKRLAEIVPYAVVMDGQWQARGGMGWFGISDDKVSESDWSESVRALLEGLPPTSKLTIVDCHI